MEDESIQENISNPTVNNINNNNKKINSKVYLKT